MLNKLTVVCGLVAALLFLQAPAVGAQWNGRITDENVEVSYSVSDIEEGDSIRVTMTRLTGNLIPFLVLRDEDEGILLRVNAEENGREAVLTYEFENDGDYEIVASRHDVEEGSTTGDFVIRIEDGQLCGDECPPVLQQPSVILQSFYPIEGTINDQHYLVNYLVYMERGQELTVTMQSLSEDLEPFIVLLDEDEDIIERSHAVADVGAELTMSIPQDGWYVLVVTRFDIEEGTTSGQYRLVIDIES